MKIKALFLSALMMGAGFSVNASDATNVPLTPPENGEIVAEEGEVTDEVIEEEVEPEKKWKIFTGGVYFGAGHASLHDGLGHASGVTWEVGLLNAIGVSYNFGNCNRLSLGFGYAAKFYKLKDRMHFTSNDEGVVSIVPFADNMHKTTSTLTIHSFQFPLLYSRGLSNGKCTIWGGAIMNTNFYASYDRTYRLDNTTYNESTNHIHQRVVTFDAIVGVQYKILSLYCRYSPQNRFKSGYGPKLDHSWTLGLSFGF